ncbi:type VI secretion system baseplate subunit TssE [Helicobacter rodentium]|uniref:type VI secretion system baseplate subunit TssE n=1 Tax=Helicobacter rodentium TaxID=59617 RepID=UPI0023F0AC4E|nr:type VI secretion system baseplate subunit TssE [Helicobacter rodentium]
MSLLDKVIFTLDDQYQNVSFYSDTRKDIKDNIYLLLNARLDDCLTLKDINVSNLAELNLNSSDLCSTMAKEIVSIIEKYEQRIKIISISFDNSLSPWRLTFMLQCFLSEDRFQEFSLEIIFKNNRYCEVV